MIEALAHLMHADQAAKRQLPPAEPQPLTVVPPDYYKEKYEAGLRVSQGRPKVLPSLDQMRKALWAELTEVVPEYNIGNNRENLRQVAEWLRGANDKCLVIYSPTFGNGKTTLAEAIVRVMRKQGRDMRYISCRKLADEVVADGTAHFAAYSGGVLLDDFGTGNVSVKSFGNVIDWGSALIERRYDNWRKRKEVMVITTNVQPSELSGLVGGRAASRMMEMCDFIHWGGNSFRY